MIQVAKDDVLRALKKCKRLAKQDLLASGLTSDAGYWSAHAEARRKTYDELMQQVEEEGVEAAYERAMEAYAALPLPDIDESPVEIKARHQALEMFFTILGVDVGAAVEQQRMGAADKVPLEATS